MNNESDSALRRLVDRWAAAYHGRRAGRQGLSVEEAADTTYLVAMRRRLEEELADIAVAAGRAARDRLSRYEGLCAIYGRSWQRAHRDKSFAHIGWRRPRVFDLELGVLDDD